MSEGKLLAFRQRSRVPYDLAYIFPSDQLVNVTPAVQVLERYGVSDADGLVSTCSQGRLEVITREHNELSLFSYLRVPAQHTTYEVSQALKGHVKGLLPPYGLELLVAKAVYLVKQKRGVGAYCRTFQGPGSEAMEKYRKWTSDGAEQTLARHLNIGPIFAQAILNENKGCPVYAVYGIQTADDAFVLQRSSLEGPFHCSRWGEKTVVAPIENASSG